MGTLFLIAVGLNFDTFSVSIVEGAVLKPSKLNSIKNGLIFGLFQAGMAGVGMLLGTGFRTVVSQIDHWIAFILLFFIGIKIMKESWKKECKEKTAVSFWETASLAFATSIDALVVGIPLVFLNEPPLMSIMIIGVLTFFVSSNGYYFGAVLKKICNMNPRMIGGVVLMGIGVKILIEHLCFGG